MGIWITLTIIFVVMFIGLTVFGIASCQYGSGIKLKDRTVTILWVIWWGSLAVIVLSLFMIKDIKDKNEAEEWQKFVKDNQCVLAKMNKNKRDNVWLCKSGTLEVISDNIE